jgi:hypothetical protein
MILGWLRRLLGRVPNPTRLLDEIWVGLLIALAVLGAVALLLFAAFPMLDADLVPTPNL